jgi:iron(III) transport system ATP-binding protein
MVFQSYAIWPHMNVYQNAAFPLEVRGGKLSRKEIAAKVMRVLRAVALDELADRPATKLSGGQQQRLALARALVMEPQLLLLDEPLSNLDAKLRERMRFELKRIQRELGITTVYVTHDQSEALALSHMIAVMNEGRIVQIGTPREIYERPSARFVADFVGTTNFLDAVVVATHGVGRCRVRSALGELNVDCVERLTADGAVVVSVRPEDVELSEQPQERTEGDNFYTGVVLTKGLPRRLPGFRSKSAIYPAARCILRSGRRSATRFTSGCEPRSVSRLRISAANETGYDPDWSRPGRSVTGASHGKDCRRLGGIGEQIRH